jgi:DNA-binding MarR family transcriptional regulator
MSDQSFIDSIGGLAMSILDTHRHAVLEALQADSSELFEEIIPRRGISSRYAQQLKRELQPAHQPTQPTPRQQKVLALIQANPSVTLAEIANAIGASGCTAYRVVKTLAARGLVAPQRERRQAERERRRTQREQRQAGRPQYYRSSRQYEGAISPDGMVYAPIVHLRAFCDEHGLRVSSMWDVLNNRAGSHRGWRSLTPARQFAVQTRRFAFLAPDGMVFVTTNLKAFCQERGLNADCMGLVHAGRQPHHKGWQKAPMLEGVAQ